MSDKIHAFILELLSLDKYFYINNILYFFLCYNGF